MWLSSIVRNRAIDAWRRAAVRPVEIPVLEDGPGQLHTAIGADTPAPERAVVLSLIAALPAPQKEAVFLAYFGGMTHDEIATWADAPLGTVKGRIRMGLQKIRAGLEEQSLASPPPESLASAPPESLASPPPESLASPPSESLASPPPAAPVGELAAVRRRRAALTPRPAAIPAA